jgi:hypothetical protein
MCEEAFSANYRAAAEERLCGMYEERHMLMQAQRTLLIYVAFSSKTYDEAHCLWPSLRSSCLSGKTEETLVMSDAGVC